MDYLGIIRKAYQITTKHKFLWIFGILAGGAGGLKSFNISLPNYSNGNGEIDKALASFNWPVFWTTYGGLILGLLAIFGIFAVVMFILNIISQGALVASVDKLSKEQKSDFRDSFISGAHQFWRILGVSVLYCLMVLASLVVLGGPTIYLAVIGQVVFAVIWGILLFFVCLAFWILVGLIYPYSLRVIILEKYGIWQSIRESLHFFRDRWKKVVVMYLLLLATSLVFGIVMVLAVLLGGGVLLAIGFGIFLASPLVAIFYGLILGLVFFIAIVIVAGGYNTFYSAALTLTYLELVKNK